MEKTETAVNLFGKNMVVLKSGMACGDPIGYFDSMIEAITLDYYEIKDSSERYRKINDEVDHLINMYIRPTLLTTILDKTMEVIAYESDSAYEAENAKK